ncbi:MAG: putative Ig domain-containing protein [bacterium]|nr:putative Ig domain-containing protein [bacterium]
MSLIKRYLPLLILTLICINTIANAATVSGQGTIRVRAGGQASFTSEIYTATYGAGDSGDFTWTETGVIPGGTITITRQPPSPFLTARLNVSASGSTQPGSYFISVNAYPATGTVGSRIVNIIVVESLGSISPSSIPDGKETAPMSVQFSVTRGSGNYTWSASGLPNGVSMNSSTGLLSGMPAQGTAGTYNTTITVTDNTDPVVSTSITIRWQVFPAYIPLSNQGQICYVKNIVRNTSGVITSTGDLFVKNLQTGVERRVTNYKTAGTGIIYNPMFTPDGSKILYGYKPNSSSNSRLYLVSTQATVSSANQGLILKKNNQEAIPSTMDTRYASISPDFTGSQGLIAFTCEKSDRAELWLYNFLTEQLSQLRSEKYLYIRHPVFLSSSTIAFVGLKNGVQDIYIVDTNGTNYRKLTTNSPVTPEYDRIQSSFRNAQLTSPLLIYAKRVYDPSRYTYLDWNVYIAEIDISSGMLTEYKVTETPDTNEFSAAFFGDSTERDWVTLVRSSGQMFYEADVIPGTRNVWQTNYDTIVPADSNSLKLQRTDSTTHTGLANWSPIPQVEEPGAITIDNTRIIYSKQSGSYMEIFRSDWTGSGFDTTGVQLTPSFENANKYNPSISKNGGLISFTMGSTPTTIFRMNCDGSSMTQFAYTPAMNIESSTVSPDGTWIVYARKTGFSTYGIFAKRVTADYTAGESVIVTGISASAIDPPSFNPDMTRIIYAKRDVGGYFDIYYVPVSVDTVGGSITALSSPINLTNTPAISKRMPAFSNTGSKIIFCSNKELIVDDYEIYTMDVTGFGIEKVVSGAGHSWPVYSPVSDAQAGTDIIGYVENGEIWYATLPRVTPPGAPSGQNPVMNPTATGITVSSGYERFSWGRKRGDGTIIATRTLPASLAAAMTITYQIAVDVDEAKLPVSFILNETFAYGTGGFTNVQVKVDGVNADSTIYTYPSAGLQTLKIAFMDGKNGGVKDHIVTITMTTPTSTGTQAFVGNLNYTIDGVPRTETIAGNGTTSVDKPYMPVDIYDATNMISPDGIIQDYDLLYTIDAWARDARLTGYGIVWPQNLGNWDTILLGTVSSPGIIPIWMNPIYMGGYNYNPTGPGASYEMYWEPGIF